MNRRTGSRKKYTQQAEGASGAAAQMRVTQTSKMDLRGPAGKRRPRDLGKHGCGPADQKTLTFAAMVGPGSPPRLALLR